MLTCYPNTSPDGAMNGDIQATRELLTELRETCRSLPRHLQADVTHVLSALAREQPEETGECGRPPTRALCGGISEPSAGLTVSRREKPEES